MSEKYLHIKAIKIPIYAGFTEEHLDKLLVTLSNIKGKFILSQL